MRLTVPGAMPEHTLEGNESQESNDPVTPTPARVREIGERTLGGSKASKRACRRFTGELGSGERSVAVDVLRHARRNDLAPRETVVLAHASGDLRVNVAKGRRGGESGVNGSPGPRRRSSNANPQGSKGG